MFSPASPPYSPNKTVTPLRKVYTFLNQEFELVGNVVNAHKYVKPLVPEPSMSPVKDDDEASQVRRHFSFEEISALFGFPEIEATKLLGVSSTQLKRIKKKLGIDRWPYSALQKLYSELDRIRQMRASAVQLQQVMYWDQREQEIEEQVVAYYQNPLLTKQQNRASTPTMTEPVTPTMKVIEQVIGSPKENSSDEDDASSETSQAADANQKKIYTFDDIAELFVLPELEAAKKLGITNTKLKRIKKKLGIERWPFRALQQRFIQLDEVRQMKRAAIDDQEAAQCAQRETELEQEILYIRRNPNSIAKKKVPVEETASSKS